VDVREDFLAAARSAAGLLREPAVAAAWGEPSALPEFTVGGLGGHLAYQVFAVQHMLAAPPAEEPTISLPDHYGRLPWIGAPLDADVNVGIRRGGEEIGAAGPEALVSRVDSAIAELADRLPGTDPRPVHLPFWGAWSLTLDDLLITRTMELAVHSDDLAVSVGVVTPELPQTAVDSVIDLLSRVAVRRHGATAVLRALSRAERAPASIAAF
jgi:hypothetical protein